MTTRQRAYQIRHRDAGLCIKCCRRAKSGLCKRHRAAHNAARATEANNTKRRERRRVLALMRRPWLFFGLAPPYTESDVRRAFMKVVRDRGMHPDVGGDEAVFKFFNIMKQKAIAVIVPVAAIEVPTLPPRRKRKWVKHGSVI